MQSGHTNFFPEATNQSATRNTYFVRTDGDGTITGGLTVKGPLDVEGSAQILQSLTVGKPQPAEATLDVDGAAHFVAPGTNPSNGGVQINRTDGSIDIGFNGVNAHGSIQVNRADHTISYNLDINPNGGDVTIGSVGNLADLTVNGNIATPGDIEATGLIVSNESIGAVSAIGVAYVIGNATGELKLNGDLDVYPTGQSTTAPSLHHLDSTPGSTGNYLTAGGGKIGFGGIRAPAQQIDVSGNIQASAAILSGSFMKAFQVGPLAAYSVGLFGGGDAIIPNGTNASPFISIPGLTDSMNLGARIMLTYKCPTGGFPFGPADCGGGALTAVPAAGGFTVYSQNNITVPLPGLPGATVSWFITDLG